MSFNQLDQRGIPLDRQVCTWRELDVTPIGSGHCDPYTRCRIITMNGIEIEAIFFPPPGGPPLSGLSGAAHRGDGTCPSRGAV
jgi:hypothetical protein